MFTVELSGTRLPGRFWAAFWAVMAFCGAGALNIQAQPAPANDDFTNAQVILGITGNLQTTNISATVETGEPAPVRGVPAQSTIWYVWTAPTTITIDFNTRDSTDKNGLPLDTMLGVYVATPGQPVTFANLIEVAGNEQDPSGGVTSRVDFQAAQGTTYYLQVGSVTNADGLSQGFPHLNWGPSLAAGNLGFSTPDFWMSSMENFLPDNINNSVAPSLFGLPPGSANARITVARTGASVGRCEVTLTVGAGLYTNFYITNYVITNIFITNSISNVVSSFTNIFETNAWADNEFENLEEGIFGYFDLWIDETTAVTNRNGTIVGPFITTTFGLPGPECTLEGTFTGMASNANDEITTFTTNIICTTTFTESIVPSAYNNVQFTGFTTNLTFDDYQMSQDVYLQIYPILNSFTSPYTPFGQLNPQEAVEDFYSWGPEDLGYPTNWPVDFYPFFGPGVPNLFESAYNYPGLNPYLQLTLSAPVLDPQENPDILAPTLNPASSTAYAEIQNYIGSTAFFDTTNSGAGFYDEINFERYSWRCDKNCQTAVVAVQRSLRGAESMFIHYTIDSRVPGITVIDDNGFAAVADSDYAEPQASTNQQVFDFQLPKTSDWTGVYGTLTFPTASISPEGIYIPITNNQAVEFDSDIELELFYFGSPDEEMQERGLTPIPAEMGRISLARLTINFNDIATNHVQPGGAVDRVYNVDAQADSYPPENLVPGANSAVNAVAIQPLDGQAVIGGDFDAFNTTPINYIARLQTNGLLDNSFATKLGRGPNNFVNAIVIDSSGRIVIGGNFTSVNGVNAFYIARLNANGSLDTTFSNAFGFNAPVYALALDASGNILVGGDFTSFDKTNCNHIARLFPGGGMDPGFLPSSGIGLGNGTDQDVHAVAVDNSGNIILGGNFTRVNGTNWNHIARLLPSGALDTTFNVGFGADGNVLALAVQSDNSIILGGSFQNFNLLSRNSIARLTPSGALDASFAPGTGFNDVVYSLVVQPDGNILAGGQFTMYNGVRRVGMARLLGGQGGQAGEAGWLDTSFMDPAYNQFAGVINHYYNTNAYNTNDYPPSNDRNQILSMGLQTNGDIVIGGSFDRVGGGFTRTDVHNHQNVARIIGAPTVGPELKPALGNYPGNIGVTQNPYTVDDTGFQLFVTLDRVNGSLGPAALTLGTNTLPPSSSSATANDFGLKKAAAEYDTVYDIQPQGAGAWGWRKTDGEFGFNNNVQSIGDNGESVLYLNIHNDPNTAPTVYADLNLLNLNANNIVSLGGVTIPFGPALGQYTSQLEIINDNFPTGTIGFSASNDSVLVTGGTITLTLVRTNGTHGSPTVTVNTVNGTAIENTDYGPPSPNPVTFSDGQATATVTIPIIDQSSLQSNKFFTVFLSSPTAGATLDTNVPPLVSSNAVVTIIDDHFSPGFLSFSAPTYSVLKGDSATISVTRVGAALGQLSVEVGTSNGTAVNTVNYEGVTNTLTWNNLDISTKTITVPTLQDGTVEGPKTVNLFLFNPQIAGNSSGVSNAEVLTSPSNAVLTILDTDAYGNLSFLSPNFSVFQNAGQALITVTRTGGTDGSVSVQYATYTPTNVLLPFLPGMPGSNYSSTSGSLTFGPGVSSQSFSVPIINTPGETTEADRIVGLELFSGQPTNIAAQFPKTATLTILDPKLHINSAGSVDTTTQNGLGFNNVVNSLCLQPDGSLLAGGEFTSFNGYPFDYVSRLLPNGGFDTGFLTDLTGPNGTIWAVLSQAPSAGLVDGNVMIVGDFSEVNLANSPNIARLNLNGQLDTSFQPGPGADGAIYCIAQMFLPSASSNQANAPYYVIGGLFANYNGSPASGVARVTPSGSFDPSFNIGLGVTSSNAAVHAVAITPTNQILVAGDFTAFDDQPHHHLVRLNEDGTLDTTFTPFDGVSSDINGSIRALVVQPDGRILIGGDFTIIDGANFNYIARLNSDGTLDTNFNVGVGCNNEVQAIALDSQLRILVGGAFTQASGVTRNGLTRLNPDGTVDPSINFGFGANGYVDAITVQTNDEINVAGGFSTFGNLPENNFVRLYGGANVGDGSVQFIQQVYGILESGTNATITFERIGGTFGTPSVSAVFSTSNGTAVAGVNYSNVTKTISFPLGETFASATVPVIDNATVGPNLFVNLLLTNPPANTEAIGPQVDATLIITNVNAGLEFAATGFRQTATAGVAAIPIVRVGNPESMVFVTAFTGTNGTATPGVDYEPETNQLTFYPGEITNYFFIPLLNSLTTFEDTTVSLGLEDASNAIVTSPSTAILTISSAQTGAGFLSLSSNVYTVSEGATNAVITILRTNGNDNNVTVQLTTTPGTAVPGVNYSNVSKTVEFVTGQNVATVDIPLIQQPAAGPNTTVNITLSDPTGNAVLGTPTNAVLTIVDDIADYYFSSGSYFVSEASGIVTLTILRGGPSNFTSSVFYTTYSPTNVSESNGFALPNVDYVPTSGTLTFQSNVSLQTIPVTIIQGTNVNPVLSFQVLLEKPSAGTQIGSPGAATVGIVSDVTGFDFATNSYVVGENGGSVVVTVNRLNPDTGNLSVHFSTSDNTAIRGVDYVATNGTLNFLDGQATNSFTVQILNPHIVESDKNFSVSLFGPSSNSYVVAPSNTVITITNVYVGLSFGTPNFSVSECAPLAAIPVFLTGLTNSEIEVGAFTQNGSGIAGVNYDAVNTNLIFLPGQTVAYFYVTPINNHLIGPDHTVQLNLTNSFVAPPTVAGVELLNPSTALLTIQECNGAFIVASGTAFVNGSIDGSSGVIYSNDTVTVLLGLRDIAGGNTTNLVATLQASNGVTNPSAAKSYGVLIENGPTVSEPFTFTAKGTNGQNITATLTLQDGSRNLGTVGFGFTVGGNTVTYANTNTLFLPENPPLDTDQTMATNSIPPSFGYPSLIDVESVPGFLTKATVTLSNFGHSYPADVDVVLEAPNGSNSILLSHCGGITNVAGLNLTFDQAATKYVPTTNKLTSGTYLPTEYINTSKDVSEMYLLPAVPSYVTVPVGAPESPFPYGTNLSVFAGASPNGDWSLWAISERNGDSGYISNGWVLNLSTGVPVANNSDLQVTVSAAPSQPTVSNPLTYYVSVTNYGPSGATNLVITDYLPAGALYVSNSCNCGTETNGILTVSLPTLAVGAGTAFSLVVEPTNLGYITNVVTALALEPDVNSNNLATNISLISPASADLGINLAGTPNLVLAGGDVVFSVQVTNGGPSEAIDATAVLLTPGFVVGSNGISASTGTFTNVGGAITWTLGDLPFTLTGLGATMTVTAEAITAGTNLASASVSSAVYDPLKGNNFSSVKIIVEQPFLSVSGSEPSYQLTWSATATNYILQGAYALPPQGTWTAIPTPPIINGQYIFTLPGPQGYQFFRLSTQ